MSDCTCKIHSPATPPEDVRTHWHQGGWRELTPGCPAHDTLEEAYRAAMEEMDRAFDPAVGDGLREDSKPPERIWLQWHGDADPDNEMGQVYEKAVTWCRDQVFDRDVEYRRVDLEPQEEPKRHPERRESED